MKQEHAILLLNKPKGITSAKAISKIKRLGQKKIGHCGTLDPMATGLLIVLLGEATKISSYVLEEGEKTYSGVLMLGTVTDTWDAEGQVLEENSIVDVNVESLYQAVNAWIGSSMQEVPPYSAAKHQGQALYKLARAGKEVPVKTKEIYISQAEVLEINLPYLRFRVRCSSGSYIRSLAHSLGKRIGCGAMLTELTREYSYPFYLQDAHELDDLITDMENFQNKVLPITKALPNWQVIEVNQVEARGIKNGNSILHRPEFGLFENESKAFLSCDNKLLALAMASFQDDKQTWKILRGLLTD